MLASCVIGFKKAKEDAEDSGTDQSNRRFFGYQACDTSSYCHTHNANRLNWEETLEKTVGRPLTKSCVNDGNNVNSSMYRMIVVTAFAAISERFQENWTVLNEKYKLGLISFLIRQQLSALG